ncbi:MAG TPA: glycoside hydrolase domain-containing protein [Planctomycetota bacterium]|nr:glycoside hydrolase domain-containing protein [Planctomycetota bacterium]
MGDKAILLAFAVDLGACLSVAGAARVIQQGLDGYSGCTTATHWGKGTKPVEDASHLFLRGAHNRFRIRFELPKEMAGTRLARARLCLFLPKAEKPNFYTEIFCHEADGQVAAFDELTDYDNGRRLGAVDSVELFAPPHQGWNNFPWLPLGVPEGGKWIEFNITPLAEKWLKNPAANKGVVLIPTDPADGGRSKSTWEIDIPSATHEKAEARPRLILELAPLEHDYLVGMTHGQARVCDRSTRFGYRGSYGTSHKLSMAANEFEGFQVIIYPFFETLEDVRFTWTDLKGDGGKAIPAADIECFIEDWYKLRPNWKTRDVFFRGKLYDIVDPLVPFKPTTVKRHVHTPFYFRVRTRPDTAAGVYRGTITAQADNAKPTELSLEVKVWPYAIPEKWNFHTMGQFVYDNVTRFHGKDFNDEVRRKYYDFLLDHRFAPTEQYIPILSPRADMEHCLKRGMNTIYLSGNFRGSDTEMEQLKGRYEAVKKLGALDHALVYIGDETNKWDTMHRLADLVHAHLPGALVMIGGSFPRPELLDYIDIYDPQTGGGSKVYSLEEDGTRLIRESQERGEEFYWYVAAGPHYPHPNVQMEYPPVIGRVYFWMTWKYGVTGFEYYCYNIWERNYPKDPAERYPNSKWQADGWSRGWPSNGDGMLFYPGPLSGLRFEAIRDGIEDWESHMVLRDCVEALRHRKHAERHRDLIAEAEKLLKVDDDMVAGFTRYCLDADKLLARREALGDLIARFTAVLPLTEKWDAGAYSLAKAAEVRIARETARRRKMLRERHIKACEALKATPLSDEQWASLWPQRILFKQDFEADGDWDGEVVTENVPAGSKRALAGDAKNKYHARFLRVGIRTDHARAATTTWLKLRYFVSKPGPIEIMAFDLTQGDNYAYRLAAPEVGKWAEATLDLTRDFRRKDGSAAKMAPGDALDDLFLGAGKPGDGDCQLLVDDVLLLGID